MLVTKTILNIILEKKKKAMLSLRAARAQPVRDGACSLEGLTARQTVSFSPPLKDHRRGRAQRGWH